MCASGSHASLTGGSTVRRLVSQPEVRATYTRITSGLTSIRSRAVCFVRRPATWEGGWPWGIASENNSYRRVLGT